MFVYKNIVQMRTNLQVKSNCELHYMILRPLLSECFFQEPIKANLCRDLPKSRGPPGKNCFEGPVFNKDRLSSTPTFVIRSQKQKFLANPARWEDEKDQKYANIAESKSEMLLPKPSSKSLYCNVCKDKYEDYRQVTQPYTQHIKTERHKNKVQSNTFNKHIMKLSAKYQKKRRSGQFKERDNTATASDFSNVIIIDQDSIEQKSLSKPRKKVKVQNPRAQNQYFNNQVPAYGSFHYYQGSPIVPQMPKFYSFCNGYVPFLNVPHHQPYLSPLFPMINQHDQKYYNSPMSLYYNQIQNYNPTALLKPPEQTKIKSMPKAQPIIIQD